MGELDSMEGAVVLGTPASPKQPNPLWFHLLENQLQEGRGQAWSGRDLLLASHAPWPAACQALAHFLHAGNSPDLISS